MNCFDMVAGTIVYGSFFFREDPHSVAIKWCGTLTISGKVPDDFLVDHDGEHVESERVEGSLFRKPIGSTLAFVIVTRGNWRGIAHDAEIPVKVMEILTSLGSSMLHEHRTFWAG